MTDWSTLRDAYGSATEVPALFARWDSEASDQAHTELWSRLCHQGSVYTASFAALPLLADFAARKAGNARRDAVVLAGAIMASTDHGGARDEVVIRQTAPELEHLALECLGQPDVDDTEFCYVLTAVAALRGDRFWGNELSSLASGETDGPCLACKGLVIFALSSNGYFAAAGDYVRDASVTRVPILPARVLSPDGAWIEHIARSHGRADVADRIRHLFGTSSCPFCSADLSIEAVIKAR